MGVQHRVTYDTDNRTTTPASERSPPTSGGPTTGPSGRGPNRWRSPCSATASTPSRGPPAAATTVADYPTNEGYPRDDPVVEVVYPFSKGLDHPLTDLPRYSFPFSRLEAREESLVGALGE